MSRTSIGLILAACVLSACSDPDASGSVEIEDAPETITPAEPAPAPVQRATIDVPTAPLSEMPVRLDSARELAVVSRRGDDAKAFDVLRSGNTLIYRKMDCTPEHRDIRFSLHVVPQDESALPEGRSFINSDFTPTTYYVDGSQCYTLATIPDIGAAELRTGQWERTEGTRWSVTLDPTG